jgi:hypothetical protein
MEGFWRCDSHDKEHKICRGAGGAASDVDGRKTAGRTFDQPGASAASVMCERSSRVSTLRHRGNMGCSGRAIPLALLVATKPMTARGTVRASPEPHPCLLSRRVIGLFNIHPQEEDEGSLEYLGAVRTACWHVSVSVTVIAKSRSADVSCCCESEVDIQSQWFTAHGAPSQAAAASTFESSDTDPFRSGGTCGQPP